MSRKINGKTNGRVMASIANRKFEVKMGIQPAKASSMRMQSRTIGLNGLKRSVRSIFTNSCPECGVDLVADSGEYVCPKCGLVKQIIAGVL